MLTIWQQRAFLAARIREWFGTRDFLEIETPILVTTPGTETFLGYFETTWQQANGTNVPLYLRSSPELHLKRCLAQGASRVFQLAKCFRNDGELSPLHHPEFTMLEWYESGLSYQGMIEQTIALMQSLAESFATHWQLPVLFNRKKPTVLSVYEAFERFAGIELRDNDVNFASRAIVKGIPSIKAEDDFSTTYYKILLQCIEPELTKLSWCILKDYPPSQAALAQINNGVAERFEMYVHGIELCNAFHELIDPAENQARFLAMNPQRNAAGKPSIPIDEAFLSASAKLPPCSGNALGFDRLLCLLQNQRDLAHAIPFRCDKAYLSELLRMDLIVLR